VVQFSEARAVPDMFQVRSNNPEYGRSRFLTEAREIQPKKEQNSSPDEMVL
jgi:hypothetical protein